MKRKFAYIIGAGTSLLNLTDDEKTLLNDHPRTFAMNKYLLFYDILGIVPKAVFLADSHYPAQYVFFESIKIANQLNPKPHFFANIFYKKLFSRSILDLDFVLYFRYHTYRYFHYWIPWFFNYEKITFFNNPNLGRKDFFWGKSLDDDLYFYRGSLTTAINLVNILYPECDICLLGIDLKSIDAFYTSQLQKHPALLRKSANEIKKESFAQDAQKHLTSLTYNGTPGVQHVLPNIVSHLKNQGINLYSGNPDSLLVEEGICDFKPLFECGRE